MQVTAVVPGSNGRVFIKHSLSAASGGFLKRVVTVRAEGDESPQEEKHSASTWPPALKGFRMSKPCQRETWTAGGIT